VFVGGGGTGGGEQRGPLLLFKFAKDSAEVQSVNHSWTLDRPTTVLFKNT
jgi:hypothetical protein